MSEVSATANPSAALAHNSWLRVAALVLAVVALGVPVNDLYRYAVLLIAAVLIFSGRLSPRPSRWLAAIAVVAAAASLPWFVAPVPIQQGLNVFLPTKTGNVFERKLPNEVYSALKTEFDAVYPPAVRCKPGSAGCWQDSEPDHLYAFSADSPFAAPAYSRAVSGLDFSDAVWLRLGFINDMRYNWYTDAPDVHRGERDRHFWMGLSRWHVTMPWFMMLRVPADYTGARLCWRGEMLWPSAQGPYQAVRNGTMVCRTLTRDTIGKPIYAAAIKPGSLAMALHPPAAVQVRLIVDSGAALLAVLALLLLLVRVRPADTIRPFVLIGLALMVIIIIDASFIGGWRPMDGGDDGLFYTGVGRQILQYLVHGDILAALKGNESVYYYGGPGLRYWRALEMIVFGDTNLGYLSLVLLLPMVVLGLFKRFVSDSFAWRLALVFVAVPVGELFGSSLLDYAKWAARGFADPAAHILLLWGVLVVVAPRDGATDRFGRAAGGALLLALAVFTKPIVAPIPGIVLAGAALAALYQKQWSRIAGLCVGFVPVLAMPLHNLYFGHEAVLLSSNSCLPGTCVMPPSAILSALAELARLDFGGTYLHRAAGQIVAWLSEPSQTPASIPFNIVGVVIVFYVTVRGRDFDPWLRLIGAAVLAEYAVDFVYVATPRYYFEMWLLSVVIVAAFIEQRLPGWMDKRGWTGPKQILERFMGYRPAQAT